MEHQIHASHRVYQLTAARQEREREIRRQIMERRALEEPVPASIRRPVGVWRRVLIRTHLVQRPA